MNLLLYAVVAIGLIGSLVAGYAKIHGDGVDQGRAEVQTKWNAANEKARREEAERQAAAELTASTAAAELAAAQQKGAQYYENWQKARRSARNADLASCSPTTSTAANAPTGDPGKPEPRFSLRFIRLYDSAWTDSAGKPVWPDDLQRGGAETGGETATAEEVLENHGANAKACSENARRLDNLTAKINRLRAGWK